MGKDKKRGDEDIIEARKDSVKSQRKEQKSKSLVSAMNASVETDNVREETLPKEEEVEIEHVEHVEPSSPAPILEIERRGSGIRKSIKGMNHVIHEQVAKATIER